MKVIHIVAGAFLILACTIITLIVLFQRSKNPGMNSAISGGSNESFFGKSGGSRTKEAKLNRLITVSAVVFFALTLTVNILSVYVD